jgi:hypothetical protein
VTALSDLLAEHRPWSSHRCRCGWEGDWFDVHLHDMLIIPANRDALVAGLIEAGVLERVSHEYLPEFSEPCENCNGCGQAVSPSGVDFCHCCDGSGLDEPIYRTA